MGLKEPTFWSQSPSEGVPDSKLAGNGKGKKRKYPFPFDSYFGVSVTKNHHSEAPGIMFPMPDPNRHLEGVQPQIWAWLYREKETRREIAISCSYSHFPLRHATPSKLHAWAVRLADEARLYLLVSSQADLQYGKWGKLVAGERGEFLLREFCFKLCATNAVNSLAFTVWSFQHRISLEINSVLFWYASSRAEHAESFCFYL